VVNYWQPRSARLEDPPAVESLLRRDWPCAQEGSGARDPRLPPQETSLNRRMFTRLARSLSSTPAIRNPSVLRQKLNPTPAFRMIATVPIPNDFVR